MAPGERHAEPVVGGKPLRALVLEDDPADFEILEHHLRAAGFRPDCTRVETEAEFAAQLLPNIDVVLSDYKLAGWDALRALELYRTSRLDIPFILVSGTISEEVAVECMKRGAADYLLKDRLGRLGPAITRARNDIAEKRLAESLSSRLLKAHEEERKKVARELHDQVGGAMATLLLGLNDLDSGLPPDGPAQVQLQALKRLAEENVAIVRNIALLLRPSMLDELGLIPALNWQAREVFRRTGMEVAVDADDACDHLPDEYRTCIYRLVQESLQNAARHAKAAHARVTVREEPAQIRLSIQDDGAGFDPRHQKGMGILGMEERVRHVGGVFHIDSQPDQGAQISILLPRGRTGDGTKE